MTEQPQPSVDPTMRNSSPIDATIDPAPAAPGPLFAEQSGELKSAPIAQQSEPAVDQPRHVGTPPQLNKTAPTPAPALDQPVPAISGPLSMQKAPAPGPEQAPWTGRRAPFAGDVGRVAADSEPETASLGEVPVRPFVALAERPQAVLGSGPAAVFPVPNEPMRAAMGTDVVTCPECGQLATVDMARRQADDFCRRCDFPLFWARGTVIAPEGAESGASLRRLPGTVGRAATAALICPHCSEPNSPAAEICVRCALSLHPVDIPEPEPVVIAPPEPEPEPEPLPEKSFDWWWVVAIAAALIAIALLVGLLYLR